MRLKSDMILQPSRTGGVKTSLDRLPLALDSAFQYNGLPIRTQAALCRWCHGMIGRPQCISLEW